MPISQNCQLGPLTIRFEGRHVGQEWASQTFRHAASNAKPDVTIQFVDHKVHPGPGVGDKLYRVSDSTLSFQTRRFHGKITRGGSLTLELNQRDRRALWLRSLSDAQETWKMWLSHGLSLDTHLLKDLAYLLMPVPVLPALLEKDCGLIHASAFEVAGKGVLLPAWGGVGKSTMVTNAVLHGSAQFVADDHCIVGADGQMYLHPMPIHCYAYHLDNDPELCRRVLAGLPAHCRRQWPIARTVRRKRAVRWARPASIFGEDRLSPQCSIEEVIVMFRSDVDEFEMRDVTPEEAAAPSTGIILKEISHLCPLLAAAESGWNAAPIPGLGESHARLLQAITNAYSHAGHCRMLAIPRSASATELVSFLCARSELIDAGLHQSR